MVQFPPNTDNHTTLSFGSGSAQLITPQTLFQQGRNNQLDFRIAKEFRIRERWTIEPTVDFFNILDAGSILAMNLGYGSAWQNVTTLLAPRTIKFGVHVEF